MFFMVMALAILVCVVMMCLFILISLWVDINSNFVSSYECGFDAKTIARMTFSYRFFLIAILFMIFDVEISLLLSLPYVKFAGLNFFVLSLFVLLLVGGLVYECQIGSLDWL